MKLETRLEQLKRYRKEAMLDPVGNKLYIEDLNLSIKLFQSQVETQSKTIEVKSGGFDAA